MSKDQLKPEVIVFAGPNGSGKSTIAQMARTVGVYINADEIKRTSHCTDLEAAQIAERIRTDCLRKKQDFTFETVLSTDRNLKLLQEARKEGYFLRCFYVLTADTIVNVTRVQIREEAGGHGVPEDKIVSRYYKALKLIPELVEVCDIVHIYDNTKMPFRIFKKRKTQYFCWENPYWKKDAIAELTGIRAFDVPPQPTP